MLESTNSKRDIHYTVSSSIPKSYYINNKAPQSVIIEDRESEDEIVIGTLNMRMDSNEVLTVARSGANNVISSIPSSKMMVFNRDGCGESTAMSQSHNT